MPVTRDYTAPQGLDMGKKKTPSGDLIKQVNIRFPDPVYARIEKIAETLGLDLSNFLRMVINENLAAYERRAQRIQEGGE